LTNFLHTGGQRRITDHCVRPRGGKKFLFGHHLSRAFDQIAQYGSDFWGQSHFLFSSPELPRSGIEAMGTKDKLLLGLHFLLPRLPREILE
jgi:hypothetical protein